MIDPELLSYTYNYRGYTITYDGQNIGGGGIAPQAKSRRTRKNLDFWHDEARLTKRDILAGRVSHYMLERIEAINKERERENERS